jgi:hypothetical protein
VPQLPRLLAIEDFQHHDPLASAVGFNQLGHQSHPAPNALTAEEGLKFDLDWIHSQPVHLRRVLVTASLWPRRLEKPVLVLLDHRTKRVTPLHLARSVSHRKEGNEHGRGNEGRLIMMTSSVASSVSS